MDLAAAAQEQRHVLGSRLMDMGSPQVQGGMGELGAALQPKDWSRSPGQGLVLGWWCWGTEWQWQSCSNKEGMG